MILHHAPWDRQPPPHIPARGDVLRAWSGNRRISGQLPPTLDGGGVLGYASTRYGVSNDFSGAGNGALFIPGPSLDISSGVTLVAIAQPVSASGVGHEETVCALSSSASSNSWIRIECRDDLGGGVIWNMQSGNPVTANMPSGVVLSAGRPDIIIAVWRPGSGEKSLWVNGGKVAVSTTDWGAPTPDQLDVGVLRRNANPVHYFTGAIPLACAVSGAFGDGMCAAVSANPFRLFAERRARITLPSTAPTAPALLTASAINIASTSFRPRVTFTR